MLRVLRQPVQGARVLIRGRPHPPGAQVKFRDVFDRYDTSRRGSLGLRELARLVRDVTPDATDSQIKYFLVRACGSGGRLQHACRLSTLCLLLAPDRGPPAPPLLHLQLVLDTNGRCRH